MIIKRTDLLTAVSLDSAPFVDTESLEQLRDLDVGV